MGYSLLLATHHVIKVTFVFFTLLLPEVVKLLLIEALPCVRISFASEDAIATRRFFVHTHRVRDSLSKCLIIGILSVIVADLRFLILFLRRLPHFILGNGTLVLGCERTRVRIDVSLVTLR